MASGPLPICIICVILCFRSVTGDPFHMRSQFGHRISRDVGPTKLPCDANKGHFDFLPDNSCPTNTEYVVDIGCCVKCTVSCPVGKRKATDSCHTDCVDCGLGTYNDDPYNRKPKCNPCEDSCDDLFRKYSQPCTIKENAKCGGCIEEYYAETSHKNGTLSACHQCFEGSDNPTCISFYNKKKLNQLRTIIAVSIVGGLVIVVVVIIAAVCTIRKVKVRRQESERRHSRRANQEMDNLMDKKKDPNTSIDFPDSKPAKAGRIEKDEKVTHGVQTGESLRYTGNGGDEKKGVTFGPDPDRKKKGILKVDVSRRPGDGEPAPPISVDPNPTLDSKSPFSSTPWWLQNNNSGQSPNDSMVSNEVFLDGKNTPVPPTPEYEANTRWKPSSLGSCVSRQSSNFQSLPSDPDE